MHSRSRKYRKSFDNYEQAIEKQLNDDFQVNEYIEQNKLEANMEEYLKLFNSLQVTKNQKKKKFDCLRVSYTQMNTERLEKTLESSQVQNWGGIKEEFTNSYEQMQIRTINEIEVKNNLWKEIVQTKKSLNLLKGDIGHLVSRNESANLLESKISKVKIVADDQLKRVSMAFVKDKEELKIRGDMQKKFNKKLKNVTMFQNSTLNRFKKNYIDTMVKKKKIHDRLAYIEKVSASINEIGDKEKVKNKINKKSLDLYNTFTRLSSLIQKIPEIESKYGNTSEEIHQFVNEISGHVFIEEELQLGILTKPVQKSRIQESVMENINYEDLAMVNGQKLNKYLELIRKEHTRLVQEIEQKSSQYNWQVKKSQEIVSKLQQCDVEINKIRASQIGEAGLKYVLSQQKRQQYSQQLKKFVQFLKTIFALLEYIEKYLNYSGRSSEHHRSRQSLKLKKHQMIEITDSFNVQQNPSLLIKPSIDKESSFLKVASQSKRIIPSDSSMPLLHQGYVSELYKIYYILLKEDQSESKLDTIETNIFDNILSDTKKWLNEIKNDMIQGSKRLIPHFYRKTQKRQTHILKPKISVRNRDSAIQQMKAQKHCIQTEEEESIQVQKQNDFIFQNFSRHQTVHKEDNPSRNYSYSTSMHFGSQSKFFKMNPVSSSIHKNRQKGGKTPSSSSIVNLSKLNHCASQPTVNEKKALRIKFLEDLDQDYYKILKSTLKMEKENTRKNYQFLRTFKRAKYSSRDQILEEKRYECSYSMLFAGKKDMKEKPESKQKKSCFFTNENTSTRASKLIEPRKDQRSSKLIKSSISTLHLNEKDSSGMKENIQAKKPMKNLRNTDSIKRNLSIQMKDVINLV